MREHEETISSQEKLSKPPKLLLIPGIHVEQVLGLGLLDYKDILLMSAYWQKAERFTKPALSFEGQVRLYLEAVTSLSAISLSNDDLKFHSFLERVRKETETEFLGGQWSVALPILERDGPTIVEFAEDREAYKQTRKMVKQSLQLDADQMSSFWERHGEEFQQLQTKRNLSFVNSINHTLQPNEIGVLILGAGHPLEDKININIKIDIFEDFTVYPFLKVTN